jgi:hypothetical protein
MKPRHKGFYISPKESLETYEGSIRVIELEDIQQLDWSGWNKMAEVSLEKVVCYRLWYSLIDTDGNLSEYPEILNIVMAPKKIRQLQISMVIFKKGVAT